jgi:hypothetical protein
VGDYLRQGYTPEQIVEMANNPLITLTYIEHLQKLERSKTREPNLTSKNSIAPSALKIHNYAQAVGTELFLAELKETGYKAMAEKLETTKYNLYNYVTRNIRGSKDPKYLKGKPTIYASLASQGLISREPDKTIDDILNLW